MTSYTPKKQNKVNKKKTTATAAVNTIPLLKNTVEIKSVPVQLEKRAYELMALIS